MSTGSFGGYVRSVQASGGLVVQPRMGFAGVEAMKAGLLATKQAAATTVGTLTLDSYTRLNDHGSARDALRRELPLNGFPLVAHGAATTRAMVDGISAATFPIQVRHGSPDPRMIIETMTRAGLDATEGGPVSYCLPYGRTSLRDTVRFWTAACETLARLRDTGAEPHLETFGGCMMGQLCPPSLLVAMSVLEAMFFRQHGVHSVSLSYAQQTHAGQDEQAVLALRALAGELLGDTDWHVVIYTYMGVYPRTESGALRLLGDAAGLAVRTGAARLIVKTTAEAHRIPTIAENVAALEFATNAAENAVGVVVPEPVDFEVYAEARSLISAVLDLDDDVGRALLLAFGLGYLDVPYCVHPDNAGRSRSYLADDGRLRWARTGAMPIAPAARSRGRTDLTAAGLLSALSYVERKYDGAGGWRPELDAG